MDEWSDKNSFASIFRAGAAEAVGTFLLVFTGCAAVVSGGGLGDNQVAWAFGLAFMVLCFATADVSGGHLNPAVSIAFAVTQDIDVQRCAVYIICQCLGAVFGALFLKALTPESMHLSHLGAAMVNSNVTPAQAVFIEILITFTLTIAFFMNAQDKGKVANGNIAPIPIGFAVIVGILAAGRLSGAAMNPARALGPAIAGEYYQDHWVYWVGPIVGGVLAALTHKFVLKTRWTDDVDAYDDDQFQTRPVTTNFRQ